MLKLTFSNNAAEDLENILLFYKNNGKVITVLRVLHQSMDPHNWP